MAKSKGSASETPTIGQSGILSLNGGGRWEIAARWRPEAELTSGSVVEVLMGNTWVRTRIESFNGEYYAVVIGIQLCEGLPARLP